MNEFMLGGIAIACFAVALFFIRYWRSSADRFFLFMALSFLLEGVNRVHMAWIEAWREDAPINYVVRLISYALILVAIWEKNRPRDR